MPKFRRSSAISAFALGVSVALPAAAEPFFFSTGNPIDFMASATRPDTPGKFEIKSADDFVLTSPTSITSATFTGLLTGSTPTIGQVVVEIYRVFPANSDVGRTSGPADLFDKPGAHAGQLTLGCGLRQSRQFGGGRAHLYERHVGEQFHRAQFGAARRHPSQTRPDNGREWCCLRARGRVQR